MSKSILVVDTPESCMECPMCFQSGEISIGQFEYRRLYSCRYAPSDIEDFYLSDILNGKPYWCPLKDVPCYKTLYSDPYYKGKMDSFNSGYNACINEILKGSD